MLKLVERCIGAPLAKADAETVVTLSGRVEINGKLASGDKSHELKVNLQTAQALAA